MKVIREGNWCEVLRPTVLTFGVFDGLHIGHQKIIQTVVERARALSVTPTVVTFDPHPRVILHPEAAPPLLQTLERRLEGLEALGIEQVVVLNFTRELAATPAEEFLVEYVFGHLDALELYLGKGAAFGRGRVGRMNLAIEVACRLGRFAAEVPEVRFRRHRVSATLIRRLLRAGHVNLVRRMLGRPFEIEGQVVKGHGLGRELLFPTANLNSENEVTPAPGVYVTLARVSGVWLPSVTNIGYRPTFGGQTDLAIEAHLLDFHENIVGSRIRLQFLHRLRAERPFSTVEELRQQIFRDSERARRYFHHPTVRQSFIYA